MSCSKQVVQGRARLCSSCGSNSDQGDKGRLPNSWQGQRTLQSSTLVWLWHGTAQHSTAQHSTAQHSTAQHSTAQHSTAQCSQAQYSMVQHSAAKHSTAWCSTAQCTTARCNPAQGCHLTQHSSGSSASHSTAQHATAQRSMLPDRSLIIHCSHWQKEVGHVSNVDAKLQVPILQFSDMQSIINVLTAGRVDTAYGKVPQILSASSRRFYPW